MDKLILAATMILVGCSNAPETERTLRAMGFTNIRTTGWKFGACGRDDTYCTGFEALNGQGQPVSGAVGCGMIFKNCTVRF